MWKKQLILSKKETEWKQKDEIIKTKFDKEQINNFKRNFKHCNTKLEYGGLIHSLAMWFKPTRDLVDVLVATPTYFRLNSIKQSRIMNLRKREKEKLKKEDVVVHMRSIKHKTNKASMNFLNANGFATHEKNLKLIYSKDNNSFSGHAFVADDSKDTANHMKNAFPKSSGKEIPSVFFDDVCYS